MHAAIFALACWALTAAPWPGAAAVPVQPQDKQAGSGLLSLRMPLPKDSERSSRVHRSRGRADHAERQLDNCLVYKFGGRTRRRVGKTQYALYAAAYQQLDRINHEVLELSSQGKGHDVEDAYARKNELAKKTCRLIYAVDGGHQIAALPSYLAATSLAVTAYAGAGEATAEPAEKLLKTTHEAHTVKGSNRQNDWAVTKGPDGQYIAPEELALKAARERLQTRRQHEKQFRKATGLHVSRKDHKEARKHEHPVLGETSLQRSPAMKAGELQTLQDSPDFQNQLRTAIKRPQQLNPIDENNESFGREERQPSDNDETGSVHSGSFGSHAIFDSPSHSDEESHALTPSTSRRSSLAHTITSKDNVPLLSSIARLSLKDSRNQ